MTLANISSIITSSKLFESKEKFNDTIQRETSWLIILQFLLTFVEAVVEHFPMIPWRTTNEARINLNLEKVNKTRTVNKTPSCKVSRFSRIGIFYTYGREKSSLCLHGIGVLNTHRSHKSLWRRLKRCNPIEDA